MIQKYRQTIRIDEPLILVFPMIGSPLVVVTLHGDPEGAWSQVRVLLESALDGNGPYSSLDGWVVGQAWSTVEVVPGEGSSHLVVMPQQHIRVSVDSVVGARDALIEATVHSL